MQEALNALVRLALGQTVDPKVLVPLKGHPVTADADVPAADGGVMEALDAVMNELELEPAKKDRLMSLLCWADEAANSKVPTPIGYVKKKIGKGPMLENGEGYMLLAYLSTVWEVPARLDEEPVDAEATPPSVAQPAKEQEAPPVVITVATVGSEATAQTHSASAATAPKQTASSPGPKPSASVAKDPRTALPRFQELYRKAYRVIDNVRDSSSGAEFKKAKEEETRLLTFLDSSDCIEGYGDDIAGLAKEVLQELKNFCDTKDKAAFIQKWGPLPTLGL
jgi:hypothetical protein